VAMDWIIPLHAWTLTSDYLDMRKQEEVIATSAVKLCARKDTLLSPQPSRGLETGTEYHTFTARVHYFSRTRQTKYNVSSQPTIVPSHPTT